MRRFVPLVLAALLALAVATPVAAGGKPEKSNNDPIVQGPDVFAGTCDFPVQLVDSFASSRNLVFPPAALAWFTCHIVVPFVRGRARSIMIRI